MRPFQLFTLIILATLMAPSAGAQQTLSLDECYKLLEQNYPLVKQRQMIRASSDLNKQAILKRYLPQINLSAQATYQSDVTHVPLEVPGMDIPTPNKDQYKATLNAEQLLYDGGAVKRSSEAQELTGLAQEQQIEVSIHQLKKSVNQWYFAVLLLQEKKRALMLTREDLNSRLNEVRSAVRNGAALPSSDDVLYAEILKVDQQLFELEADRNTACKMLSELVGTPVQDTTELLLPASVAVTDHPISRPELGLYNTQRQQLDISSSLVSRNNTPKLMLFAQGGYGNPGLNMLDNTFQPFFMGGIRLSWNLWDWNAVNVQRQALTINKNIIDNQQEVFELNTRLELTQLGTEIEKISRLIQTDDEIIALRNNIMHTARSQLKNGTITSSDYVTRLTALNEAEISKKTHEIQLLLAKANYGITQGTAEKQ